MHGCPGIHTPLPDITPASQSQVTLLMVTFNSLISVDNIQATRRKTQKQKKTKNTYKHMVHDGDKT